MTLAGITENLLKTSVNQYWWLNSEISHQCDLLIYLDVCPKVKFRDCTY